MSKLYISTIEAEHRIGVIVSPIPSINPAMDGEYIDSNCIIIWHMQGNKVPTGDSVREQVFKQWAANVFSAAGITVIIE